jgi:hypothetical protein
LYSPKLDSLRVEIVRECERTDSRLRRATPTDWAYFEIAREIDTTCNADVFKTHRRDRWREVLTRARRRKVGEAAA